jgi:osmotically-inducible protein OsmY
MIVDEVRAARQFDILVEVDRILQSSCYSALRSVNYGLSNGRLVLEGRVPSYFMKQVAQQLVASVAEEDLIDNQIVVDRPLPSVPRRLREFASAGSLAGV